MSDRFDENEHPRGGSGRFVPKPRAQPSAGQRTNLRRQAEHALRPPPSREEVVDAAAHLQQLFPDAVLVGGSAAAEHVRHRESFDDDHVLTDLRDRFDEVLETLEATAGWSTARVRRPVLILGRLDGVETGIRQLRRQRPLEVEEREVRGHGRIQVPTLAETARIKAWLVLDRNATRDYLDFAALSDRLGTDQAAEVVAGIDEYYADQHGPGGRRVASQVTKQLAEPAPYDLSDVDLTRYRSLVPRWQDWDEVVDQCRRVAVAAVERRAGETE